jgi:anti-sigma factor (TIGR02949 family)
MTTPTMTCEDAIRLIATYIDRELNEVDATQIRAHIDHCKSCYSRVEFEQKLKDQLTRLRSVPVSTELGDRVRVLLHDYGNE